MTRTLPMDYKEINEARNLGMPENIIGKFVQGIEPDEQEKDIINRYGKEYVTTHTRNGKRVKPHLRDLHGGVRSVPGLRYRDGEARLMGITLRQDIGDRFMNEILKDDDDERWASELSENTSWNYNQAMQAIKFERKKLIRSRIPRGFREESKEVEVRRMYSRAVGDYNFDIDVGQEPYDEYLGDRIGAVGQDVSETIDVLKRNNYSDDEIQDVLDDLDHYDEVRLPKPVRLDVGYFVRD